jgi:predicted nucleic acid-binding protein
MNAYLDSSVMLRLILGEKGRLRGWESFEILVTSDLAEVECLRTIDRLRLRHNLPEKEVVMRREALFRFMEAMEVVEINRGVLKRAAESFPVALGTLDAIHLATALLWQEDRQSDLVMATHDKALGQAAKAFGMKVEGTE